MCGSPEHGAGHLMRARYWTHPHYDHYDRGWEYNEGHWDHDDHRDHHDWDRRSRPPLDFTRGSAARPGPAHLVNCSAFI